MFRLKMIICVINFVGMFNPIKCPLKNKLCIINTLTQNGSRVT